MSKCVDCPKYEADNEVTLECSECKAPLCDWCVTEEWGTCDSCSSLKLREHYQYLLTKENPNNGYCWCFKYAGDSDKISRQDPNWIENRDPYTFCSLEDCEVDLYAFRQQKHVKFLEKKKEIVSYTITSLLDIQRSCSGSPFGMCGPKKVIKI